MMTAHRCQASGCGRFVRAGSSFCGKHNPLSDVAVALADQSELRSKFRERVERGDYAGLFDDHLSQVMRQAATAVAERGLTDEIGALRYVLARLLMEEDDLTKLAANVTRVTSVAVQAARAQRAISGEVAQGLTSALTQILTELDEG
ncbi:MAG: hypothetical protein ACR2GS_10120 [Thermomicrobiales bacterium]|jgi:hypothetical protein